MNEFEQRKLPNATPVLVLGISSILTCWCYGVLGVLLSVVALILASKDLKLYKQDPSLYTNYSNLNTGRILSIIGLVLSLAVILFIFWFIATVIGWDAVGDQEMMLERLREWQEKQVQ